MFLLRFTAKSTQWGRDFRLRDTKELDWYQIKVKKKKKKKIAFGNTQKSYDRHHEPVNSYILAVSRLKSDVSLRKHAYSNKMKILPPKNENFQIKNSDIIHNSPQNIYCGYSLDTPRRGGSNEYHNLVFEQK